MAKSKEETRRISGLPKDTDRVSFSWLTSEDDPHYSLHTMTYSMREVVKTKRGGWFCQTGIRYRKPQHLHGRS